MTQPTSIDMTFDTSLVDVNPPPVSDTNTSFSTIESGSMCNVQQTKPSRTTTPMPIQHMDTRDTYNQWASVYDTDGNMLQAIDDVELATLLPDFLSKVQRSTPNQDSKELRVLDLGCGTGRNTAKLLVYDWHEAGTNGVHVTGIDFSQGMLDIARTKLDVLMRENLHERGGTSGRRVIWNLECGDVFSPSFTSSLPQQHALISTLVLEHIPLDTFVSTLSSLLVKGGMALVTNMHADMGRTSQAGFVNENGVKVRGQSYIYTVEETVQAAKDKGFEVLGVWEREVTREDVDGKEGKVGQRGRKWVGVKVWYGILMRKMA